MFKNKHSALLLFVLISLLSSCKDLTQNPYSEQTPGNFYKNANQVLSAYVLPYSYMQTNVYQVHFQIQEMTTDEAVAPVFGGYVDQQGQWLRFHRQTWTADDLWIQLEWENLFQTIGYCNQFIENIKDRDLSSMDLPISKEQMVAEIKMVRALNYYWAISEFGNIPIVEEVGIPNPPTESRAKVFAFIEKQIKDNIPKLGKKGDTGWYGHFTKSAAQALLAKLYLNAKAFTGTARWDDCINACNAVLKADYSLDTHWNDPFLINNEASNENIYVVPFDANKAQGFNFIQQNLHEEILFSKYDVNYYGYNKIHTQESFYDLYQSDDLRINQWIVGPQVYTDADGNEQPVIGYTGEPMTVTPEIDMLVNNDGGWSQGVMNKKYEIKNGGKANMSNDMVIFRLADIMFAKAEAEMRKNGGATPNAVNLINKVRRRSFDPGSPNATYTTSTLTMDELLDEYGREFSYEMQRRQDLIRFGHFTDAWWEKDESEDYRRLFPIPTKELNANPALKQNPGY